MSTKRLIAREINARRERIRGVVVSHPLQRNFDPGGALFFTWVADVDIGADKVLRNVPIKINGPKARFYARPGSPVFLEKDAQGRYQIISPADRIPKQAEVRLFSEVTGLFADGGFQGNTFQREPYEFYKGITPESHFNPATDAAVKIWLRGYDRLTGLPQNISPVTDTDGAGITSITDKSTSGNNATQTTSSLRPLYRRFDSTNPNLRSTLDFDGVDDRLAFATNITIAGVISIFVMLRKEIVGGGDDMALQLGNWQLFTRRSATDNWAFNQGGGTTLSGDVLPTTTYTLLELIATSYNSVALFRDGVSKGTFTPSGSGLGLSSSFLGGNGTTPPLDGRIMELLILDETVSATKRVNIEAYFNRTTFIGFSRYHNLVDAYPKLSLFDAEGNPI
jgi:hypothetical protein